MGSLEVQPRLPPVLDFSSLCIHASDRINLTSLAVFRGNDLAAKEKFVEELGQACRSKGFFQLINHGVDCDLQRRTLAASKQLFDLPLEEKLRAKLIPGKSRRGYEKIGEQMLEPGAAPDTKEAIYLGEDLAEDHPRVLRGEFGCGPNIYPSCLGPQWLDTCMEYYDSLCILAKDVMRALAAALGISENYFDHFTAKDPAATLRLIHYPPTPKTSDLDRGCGAHRDFGCITLLLQDQVGGLQVQDEETGEFLDITPIPGAYVVNLGNLMARWTNHHYASNTHRVLNYSGTDRYSIPFFYNDNAEFVVNIIPGLEERPNSALRKYGPIIPEEEYGSVSVAAFLKEQFMQSYKRAVDYQPSTVDA